jgi:heme-degrading monooxygenase HmoA
VTPGEVGPAATPAPPYTAVIFTSVRAEGHAEEYAEMAAEMAASARRQPGFLGVETARDADTGLGITVSYWVDETAAAAWKQVARHLVAQRLGRDAWYRVYRVRVGTVHRDYGPGSPDGPAAARRA